MIYTGIGSRETPEHILDKMNDIAFYLASKGVVLRSGKAVGADEAFQLGVEAFATQSGVFKKELAEIYIPWAKFSNPRLSDSYDVLVTNKNIVETAEGIMSQIHPAWERCSQGAKRLHTRNVFQVLGSSLTSKSDFLVCYAKPKKDGEGVSGGTNTAYMLAKKNNIPTFNLYYEEELQALRDFLKENL